MEGAWILTDAYDGHGNQIAKDINFPITAFLFSSDNTVNSTGGPMFMHIVYGGSKYTNFASKVDQVFDYANFKLTNGEWFIGDGNVNRFTIEMKLEGPPGLTTFTEVLRFFGVQNHF